jgi:hypothetical protein
LGRQKAGETRPFAWGWFETSPYNVRIIQAVATRSFSWGWFETSPYNVRIHEVAENSPRKS